MQYILTFSQCFYHAFYLNRDLKLLMIFLQDMAMDPNFFIEEYTKLLIDISLVFVDSFVAIELSYISTDTVKQKFDFKKK